MEKGPKLHLTILALPPRTAPERVTAAMPAQTSRTPAMRLTPFAYLLLTLSILLTALPCAAAGMAEWQGMAARLQQLNTRILADRARLAAVSEHYLTSDDISEDDFNWLKSTAEEYGLEPRQRGDRNFFNALTARLDVVPPSLALGIGWLEYGWRPHPLSGCKAACRRLLAPEDMYAWVHELNTADRYAAFRAARLELRHQNKALTARALAPALGPMTSEGPAYSRRLMDMIQRLRLDRWDPKT